ncbi:MULTISPECIES: hypothetical protein [Thermoprotei]|uniref:hypothetical protein n=1 Tax=Thermoprotei TaxID=183924 RepID=UPI003166BB5D
MSRLKEKLGYILLIIVDGVVILFTWRYMVSVLNRSLEVAEKNPLSQDTVNAMFLAVAGVIFGSIMLILELVALAGLIERVVS